MPFWMYVGSVGNHRSVINQDAFLYHFATLGPNNTAELITILHTLHNILIAAEYKNGPQLYSHLQLQWSSIIHEASHYH